MESLGGAASPAERALAKQVLPQDSVSKCRRFDRSSVVWNQSVMELGAIVCTAKSPLCEACPVSSRCVFLRDGRPGLGERRTRPRQRFQGTDRQVRGLVLNALRNLPEGEIASTVSRLNDCGMIISNLTVASRRWMRMVLLRSCRMRMCVFRYEKAGADVLWMRAR